MKQRFLNFSFFLSFFLLFPFFTEAKEIKTGEVLFTNNCLACHVGGNNVIIPEKNLKKDALEANGMNTLSAISYQITNGKNGMPAFGGRLTEEEIEEIGRYILMKSQNDFKEL